MVQIAFIDFSKEQLKQIDDAYKNKSNVKVLIKKNQFLENGNFSVNLTKTQIDEVRKGQPITLTQSAVRILGNKIRNFLKKELKDKQGGLLPILAAIPYIAGMAGIAGGIGGVVNAINTKKHQDRVELENKRHNQAIEKNISGEGVYMRKKSGQGLRMRKNFTPS